MSQSVDVDGMTLTMPAGWWVWKYDDSAFHRNQFQSFAGGSKAVDAVAMATGDVLWLIELKDYRHHPRTKPSSVFAEVALKVRATLAGLAIARLPDCAPMIWGKNRTPNRRWLVRKFGLCCKWRSPSNHPGCSLRCLTPWMRKLG